MSISGSCSLPHVSRVPIFQTTNRFNLHQELTGVIIAHTYNMGLCRWTKEKGDEPNRYQSTRSTLAYPSFKTARTNHPLRSRTYWCMAIGDPADTRSHT